MDKINKFVSVIVPNYNHARYLGKRIESILNQTYKNFEVIILDDLSKDNSIEVINRYISHPQVAHVILNDKNSGSTFKQWNKGIALAKGDFIWIAESDDWCESTFLEKVMEKFNQFSEVGMVYCQSWKINENDEVIGSWKEWSDAVNTEHWKFDFHNNGKMELQEYFCLRNTIPNASAVVFKKDIFEPLPDSILNMRLCGDKMVWTNLLLKGDVYFISEHLNYFRTHGNNVRSTMNSLQNLYENFIWVDHLRAQIEIPKKNFEKIKVWLMKWWIRSKKGIEERKYIIPIISYGFKISPSFGFKLVNRLFIDSIKLIWR